MATAILVIAVLLLPALPPVRSAVLTAALVPELMDTPVRLLSAATEAPVRVPTTYGTPADPMDVYVPAGAGIGSRLPAVVLALGVHPQPLDSPEIIQIASTISRLGVVVGVPDSSALRNLEVTPAEPGHLADAVLAISERPEVDGSRVGLAGFSAGASMALIAAADPRIADHLSFVSSFGGYADANRLLVDVATNTTITDGVTTPWQADPGIRADIASMLLAGDVESADSIAVDDLLAASERMQAEAAIASFSPKLKDRLAGISPLGFADGIKTHVYLLHGEPDTAIPVAHAALLANGLGDRVARLTRFGEFGHGRPGVSGIGPDDLGDVVGLYLYLRDIVAATLE
jgi:dienelactone hydrolase